MKPATPTLSLPFRRDNPAGAHHLLSSHCLDFEFNLIFVMADGDPFKYQIFLRPADPAVTVAACPVVSRVTHSLEIST
jgi:hypothetical protein